MQISLEYPILMKETTKEEIIINKRMNSEGEVQKEDHFLSGIKIYFLFIAIFATIMDVGLLIAQPMEEMVKQEMEVFLPQL